jgi:hypothetical protein
MTHLLAALSPGVAAWNNTCTACGHAISTCRSLGPDMTCSKELGCGSVMCRGYPHCNESQDEDVACAGVRALLERLPISRHRRLRESDRDEDDAKLLLWTVCQRHIEVAWENDMLSLVWSRDERQFSAVRACWHGRSHSRQALAPGGLGRSGYGEGNRRYPMRPVSTLDVEPQKRGEARWLRARVCSRYLRRARNETTHKGSLKIL